MPEVSCGKKRKNSASVINLRRAPTPSHHHRGLSASGAGHRANDRLVCHRRRRPSVCRCLRRGRPSCRACPRRAVQQGELEEAGRNARARQNFECWPSTSAATANREGPGDSEPMDAPLYQDVLAAVRYLRKTGAKSVSVVGASMGGWAAGDASIASQPGEIDRLVFLGSAPNGPADKLKSPSLFIVARDDASEDGPRLPGIREQYEKAPKAKRADHSRWLCPRSVSLPNRPSRPRNARDSPLSVREVNSQKDMTRTSVGLATKSFVSFVIHAFLFQTRTDPTPRSLALTICTRSARILKAVRNGPLVVFPKQWACGAAGSALPWHGRGRRFDPDQVHQIP